MDDEILQEFLAESWENLSRLDTEIVGLEKDPSDKELLGSIFRTIHTIKGTCGFIGLNELGSVAHSTESVLGRMRDGDLQVGPHTISIILTAVDEIRELLRGLEATGREPQRDNSRLIEELDHLAATGEFLVRAEPPARGRIIPPANASLDDLHAAPPPDALAPPAYPSAAASVFTSPHAGTSSEPVSAPPAHSLRETSPLPDGAEAAWSPERPVSHGETGERWTGEPGGASAWESGGPSRDEPQREQTKSSVADLSIRVNVNVLDSLMNLVGELVLTRNQLLQMARGDEESKYAAPIGHLNRVTTDLQEGVMKTRMQPIGNAWSKLPRLVRDLAQVTGRLIELEMSGAETELDRTVLDAIKDPLTHMVRNSADHGIEAPEERRRKGKPETGRITLNAWHEGGHVIISIEDDGRGIQAEKVRRKAIEKGLIGEADASRLSENELLALIFKPGFSTADAVSSVSGRGVGMDVVKTQIERIGGTVDLFSVEGQGTTVRIKIPLTLAIISALVVEAGGESLAIPQLCVVELVRLAAEDRHKIERIHTREVFRLRNRLLPLIHLEEVLGLEVESKDAGRDVNIVVVQVGDEQFGLIVSEVFDTEEIVVKPVGALLKEISIYQGTTILGDGRVIMILDVAGIATQYGALSTNTRQVERIREVDVESADTELTSLLLFDAGGGASMAVPLALVARLEEFPRENIERSGDRLVVQYRGDLLPLLPVEGQPARSAGPLQPVIVFSDGDNLMGLMVDSIQDILEERLRIRRNSRRPGVLGTAIINGKATDVIDTQHYVLQANPDWFARAEDIGDRTILVVEDSLFFRQLVTTSLESEGYRVIAAESAVAAIELIERGERFDAIVSDIEMPAMDGCQFAEWFRSRNEQPRIPMIALSSLDGRMNEARATGAGFDRYLKKFNSQQLMSTLAELCYHAAQHVGVQP